MRQLRSDDSSSLTVQLALPPPRSQGGRGFSVPYPAIHWLKDDILLSIFHCYRLDEKNGWNDRHGWCNLSQVCERWRHLIYECAFDLGVHIKCTNGSSIVGTLDHLPPLPLFVSYDEWNAKLTEQDELSIYHALRMHGRVRHIDLNLHPFMLPKVVMLSMDEHFPILEHLSLSFTSLSVAIKNNLPLTFPKGFLAPNLRHLALPSIIPLRRLRVLTSTVSLITLKLSDIQTSSYFRPRLLVARLRSLPLLEELTIEFSIPIPHPGTEKELLGENGALITLPSLKTLQFHGVGAYLESLVAQVSVPLLELLKIKLFNQIALVLPHLFYLINITKVFKLSRMRVEFHHDEVRISMLGKAPFSLHVMCKPLDGQLDCAAQICHALIPTLSSVQNLSLSSYRETPIELRDGAVDSTKWHDLLRSFIGVKELDIYWYGLLLDELSCALQGDEVGSDPEFLPNLRSIRARLNLFTTFIRTRQVVGRPVHFSQSIIDPTVLSYLNSNQLVWYSM